MIASPRSLRSSPGPLQRSRLAIALVLTLAHFGPSGCASLTRVFTPQRAALADVHAIYEDEFSSAFLASDPKSTSGPRCRVSSDEQSFPDTLRAIRAFRVEYPGATHELAHLSVLEGMIYLQAGRLGMAALLQDDVTNAEPQLRSGTGAFTRDGLFSRSFDDLVAGWTAICDSIDEAGGLRPYGAPSAYAGPARGIVADLERAKGGLASAEADEGAIYLGTTAAIFFVWAEAANQEHCGFNRATCDRAALQQKAYLVAALATMDPYLSDSEKSLARAQAGEIDSAAGRIRYVLWYADVAHRLGVEPVD